MYKTVCVIGLGYVGFPTACVVAGVGYSVLGVDIDQSVISKINEANYMHWEPKLNDLFTKVVANGKIKITTKVEPADVYIITVQTPLKLDNKPDISHVHSAIQAIQPYLKEGNLILIESTCPIGTAETIAQKLKVACPYNVYIASCPERILPGNVVHELLHNNRIIGGIDKESGVQATNFYSSFIKGKIEVTDARTAEAVKLAENTYRDINIAYANELSMIADHININVYELIKLANNHPRVNILQPGPGVGGHCIAVDPYFLASATPELSEFILKARAINHNKTNWVLEKVSKHAKNNHVKTIACLGLSYKANVPDIRQSPAITIVENLKKEFDIIAVDPCLKNVESINDVLAKVDMVVLLVAHDVFLNIPSHLLYEKIFLDFTGTFIK